MSEIIVSVPISAIIMMTLGLIRKSGETDKEEALKDLKDWTEACRICGIPRLTKTHYRDEYREHEEDCPQLRNKNLFKKGLPSFGKVYAWEQEEYLVVGISEEEEDDGRYVFLCDARHFIFDVELGPIDYEELVQNIRGGWPDWMEVLERCKSGGRVPKV